MKESWSLKKTELGALIAQNRYLGAVPTQSSVLNKENWGFLWGGK